jgi:hypothetical protein
MKREQYKPIGITTAFGINPTTSEIGKLTKNKRVRMMDGNTFMVVDKHLIENAITIKDGLFEVTARRIKLKLKHTNLNGFIRNNSGS